MPVPVSPRLSAPVQGTALPNSEKERGETARRYEACLTLPNDELDRITRLAADRFEVPLAIISLIGEENCCTISRAGDDAFWQAMPIPMKRAHSLSASAIVAAGPLVVNDAREDERFARFPSVSGAPHVRFCAGVPLTAPGGHRIGTLCVMDAEARALGENERARLEDLASLAAGALRHCCEAAAHEGASQRLKRHVSLSETFGRISNALLTPEADLDAVLAALGEAVGAHRAYLFRMRPPAPGEAHRRMDNTHEWTAAIVAPSRSEKQGLVPAEMLPHWFERLRASEGPLQTHRHTLPPEAQDERAFLEQQGVHATIDVPIRRTGGALLGHIGFSIEQAGRVWSEEEVYLLRMTGNLLAGHFERRQTYHALRETEQVTRTLLNSITDGFFALDAELRFTYLNDRTVELAGQPREDLVGERLWDVFPGYATSEIEEQYRYALREQEEATLEVYYDPTGRWYALRIYPYGNGLSVFVEDIHERKEREKHLRLMDSAVANANDAVLITEAGSLNAPGPRIAYVNEAFCRNTGYTAEEVVGRHPRFLQGPRTDRRTLARIREALETRESVHAELANYRKDGSLFWVEMTIAPVTDADGRVTHFTAVQRDVTERKRREEALRESEEQFRAIAETVTQVFWIVEPASGEVLYVSPALEEIWGRPREVLYEHSGALLESIHPDDRERATRRLKNQSVEGYDEEYRILQPDGSVRWVRARAFPRQGAGAGPPKRIVGMAEDITERKQAEEALRESEERHRALFARSSDVTTVLGPDGTIDYESPALEKVLGRKPGDLQGENALETIHPEDRERYLEALADVQRAPGATVRVRLRVRHTNGSWVPLEAIARNLIDDPAIGGIVVNSRDMTERIEAQEKLRRSEERHRALVTRASDIMTIFDLDGTIRYESPSIKRVMGYAPASVEGTNVLDTIHPDDRRVARESVRTLTDHPDETVTVQLRVRHADGHWVPLETVMRNFLDDPAIGGLIANARDVTESLRFREEQDARRRAEELLEAKTNFLNNMSHELRTPLASIIGFADVLAEEGEGEQQEFASRIATSGERLQKTLNSVLSLAQFEGGGIKMDRQPLAVFAEANDALTSLRPAAEKKGLVLRAVPPSDAAAAVACAHLDEGALHRILDNLVGNAIKFTERGSVTVHVDADAQQVRLHVKDTGIGMSESFQQKLFDDFTQESTGLARTHEGAGLGLTITQRLVEAMDGTLAVESTHGEGSCFTATFPRVYLGPESSSAKPSPPEKAEEEQRALTSLLLVEDNPNARALARHLLRPYYRVEAAPGAEAACALADEHDFDVMLIDINLGGGRDGKALLTTLREEHGCTGVPAVAVTAHAMPGDAERFLDAGFDAYLSKPFVRDELLSTAQDALDSA